MGVLGPTTWPHSHLAINIIAEYPPCGGGEEGRYTDIITIIYIIRGRYTDIIEDIRTSGHQDIRAQNWGRFLRESKLVRKFTRRLFSFYLKGLCIHKTIASYESKSKIIQKNNNKRRHRSRDVLESEESTPLVFTFNN